jgi:hypothetical protein
MFNQLLHQTLTSEEGLQKLISFHPNQAELCRRVYNKAGLNQRNIISGKDVKRLDNVIQKLIGRTANQSQAPSTGVDQMPMGEARGSINQTTLISKPGALETPKKNFEKKHPSTFDVTGANSGLLSPRVVSNSTGLNIPEY